MAVVATTTYLYVDTSLTQHFIQGSELIDRGAWSSSAFYNIGDVIQIGVDQYIALAANSNQPPTSIVDDNWSTLVIVEEQTGSVISAGSDAYARYLAGEAYNLAVYGTYLGTQAYNLAGAAYTIGTEAYALAVLGTNAQAAIAVGTDAYHLAESGTNIAWSAYYLAQIGTNTGTAALGAAATAQSTADSAFAIAVLGTEAAANANAYAEIAWNLAQMGTNTGTAAYNYAADAYYVAQSGSNTANDAYAIAVIGTNLGSYANAFAEIAWNLAQMGTNTGTAAYNYAAQAYYVAQSGSNTANLALVIAEIGTNIAQSGTSIANSAYYTAISGSNTANDAYTIAVIGTNTGSIAYSYATSAYSIAISGSTTANDAWSLAQELAQILGLSFQGTLDLFTAQVRYGKADTSFRIIDGVLANREESKFVWEDYDLYGTTTGTNPVEGMNKGSSWDGYGSIYTNDLVTGVNGTDWANLYTPGTYTTFSNGTGWLTSGTTTFAAYWFAYLGTDTMEAYSLGTLSSSGTEINSGGGWVGTAQCYTGSNRP